MSNIGSPKTGMTTGDNDRFLRHWFEISYDDISFDTTDIKQTYCSIKWYPYAKGGDYRKWYGNNDYLVNWQNDGYEIRNNVKPNGAKVASVRSESMYFKRLITWTAVSSGNFSCRYIDKGFLFDSGGSSIDAGNNVELLLLLLNSKIGQYYLTMFNPTLNYQPGDVGRIPVLKCDNIRIKELFTCVVEDCKNDWDNFETSWDFKKHPLI